MPSRRLIRPAMAVVVAGILAGGALGTWPAGAAAATRPPTNLRLVGDHWTPWDPPTSFPEGTEVYVIQRGDTLWDLASRFYGNPYLWPQLWERNPYILDAHWIYPGDPLVVGVEVTPLEDLESRAAAAVPSAGEPGGQGPDRPASPPQALGAEDDIYCSGFVADPDETFALRIAGSEYDHLTPDLAGRGRRGAGRGSGRYGGTGTAKLNLTVGDVVYVDGSDGLQPGALYTVVVPKGLMRHPETGEVVGRYYGYQGRVQILSVQAESAIAEIVHSCSASMVGDFLRPFVPEPVPLARRSGLRSINDPVSRERLVEAPVVLGSGTGLVSLGQGHVVFIDRGAQHGVTPGDIFTIYRQTPPGQPPMVVGELAVLSVNERASLAKILESRYAIYVGDRLDPKPN